ncbi:MAG TPA: molybdopterin-dependent oxidoreductase [Gaiellaceae bacterium]|nr:molybdopterin-dependent oxidoreductase [Gaiellaceae bacterium]
MDQAPKRYGRGLFLATVAGGLTSLLWGRPVWSRASAALSGVEAIVPLVPHGWRIYSVADTMPTFDPKAWRLTIDGLVANPVSLSYDDLRSLPSAHQVSTFHCVTGWTVDNVHWHGVRLQTIFDHVQPYPEAHALQFTSAEIPYVDYLTRKQSLLPDVMLAYDMNGKPLSRDHGSPLRLVIPDMYGYKGVKWLDHVTLVPQTADGYWELLGYDRDAWVGRSNGY